MTDLSHKFDEVRVSQTTRDQNARQLRSDFLASMFQTIRNKFRNGLTHSVDEVRTNI